MNPTVLIEVIGAIGAVVAGLFALMKYVIKSTERINTQFLTYLKERNGKTDDALIRLGDTIEKTTDKTNEMMFMLAQKQERNTRVLIKAATKMGYDEMTDELLDNEKI